MSDLRRVGLVCGLGGILLAAAGCNSAGSPPLECDGTLLEIPPEGATIPQLMAHATAMGMTRREAETLIYLEGLNPQATLASGSTVCLDGQPDEK